MYAEIRKLIIFVTIKLLEIDNKTGENSEEWLGITNFFWQKFNKLEQWSYDCNLMSGSKRCFGVAVISEVLDTGTLKRQLIEVKFLEASQ